MLKFDDVCGSALVVFRLCFGSIVLINLSVLLVSLLLLDIDAQSEPNFSFNSIIGSSFV